MVYFLIKIQIKRIFMVLVSYINIITNFGYYIYGIIYHCSKIDIIYGYLSLNKFSLSRNKNQTFLWCNLPSLCIRIFSYHKIKILYFLWCNLPLFLYWIFS